MFQQLAALLLIFYFLARLFWQKKQNKIALNEYVFWLIFWLAAAGAIIFIKDIDRLVAQLGFSGSGIEILLYLAVACLFFLIFRLRLKVEKIDRNLTKIVREITLDKGAKKQ